MLREDGSGAVEYYYGKMGEVLKTVRTLIVPNQAVATYVTQWKYDSHNRLLEMIYPDEEKVTYGYNLGGQVDHVRGYKSYGYDYVNKIGYDKFEQRTYLKYCNGAETFYSYDPARRRLQNLMVNAKAGTIMDNTYSYDAVSNVLGIKNNAPLPQSGKAGGQMSHSYTYDPLYRLASATGTYKGTDNKSASYTLSMGYDNMHRITSKKQHLSQTGVQFDGTLNAGYELAYTYGKDAGRKFQLDNVRDINYRTEETPTESTNINNGHKYTYDANGNLVYINTSRVKKDGKEDEKATEQKYKWDEENRLLAADENGFVSNYWYDADGERTVKTSGENEAIYVNSEFSGGNTGTARFSLYVSPYLVAGQGGKYTKHIYIGSQRIVSKLGDLASYGADPRRIPYAGNEADGLTINYKDKYNQQLQSIKDNYKTFDLPYNGKDNDDYVNGQGFCCNDGTLEAAQARAMNANTRAAVDNNFHDKDNYEKLQFYYHPDHLGSSSYITNLDGEVLQHIEYVPFGEVFIEERNNTWNTPYLFNAKEFDEETGMYYYGARYYEPRLSLWMSTDPKEEKFANINTYCYTNNNPIRYEDFDGREWGIKYNETGGVVYANVELQVNPNIDQKIIEQYKQDINAEFNRMIKEVSSGKFSGEINFNVPQKEDQLYLIVSFSDYSPTTFAGINCKIGMADATIYNNRNQVKEGYVFAADIIHELLHTLGMPELVEPSFSDTEVKNISSKGHKFTYSSTSNTVKDVYKNVMNNYANTIDGIQLRNVKELPHSNITPQQFEFIKKQIIRQEHGEGRSQFDNFWFIDNY